MCARVRVSVCVRLPVVGAVLWCRVPGARCRIVEGWEGGEKCKIGHGMVEGGGEMLVGVWLFFFVIFFF